MESELVVGVACFWLESESKQFFFKYAQTGVVYLGVLKLMGDSYSSLTTPTPIFDELLKAIVIFII